MKNVILTLLLFVGVHAYAQHNHKPNVVTYKTLSSFPSFQLSATDGSKFYSSSIVEKNKPTVLIYFSPTCSHCQHQAEELTSNMKEFKNVNFLMVSSYSMAEIKQFDETYAVSKFPNIKLAQDPEARLISFFEIKSLPGIFVYDKQGKFKKSYPTNIKTPELLAAIKG